MVFLLELFLLPLDYKSRPQHCPVRIIISPFIPRRLRSSDWVIIFVGFVLCFFGRTNSYAQSAYISCEENFIPPLIDIDFPDYGQGLDSDVTIITYPFVPPTSNPRQPNPIAGTHAVLVYDPDHDLYRAIFYFNVNQDGTIEGAPPTSTTKDAKGNTNSYSTVIGTYFFPGGQLSLHRQYPQLPISTSHRSSAILVG